MTTLVNREYGQTFTIQCQTDPDLWCDYECDVYYYKIDCVWDAGSNCNDWITVVDYVNCVLVSPECEGEPCETFIQYEHIGEVLCSTVCCN